MKIYDLIIIGAGPAGITASVYAARKQLDFLVISLDVGGQAAWSGEVENYTGYQFISGPELARKFEEHLRRYGTLLKENEEVRLLEKTGSRILVRTNQADYQTRSVIIASGKKSRELGVAGEKEFKNRGLTYCATCDGPLFAGKVVAVVGGGNSALDAAWQLVRIAKHVYLLNNTAALGGDPVVRAKVEQSKNVTILNNVQMTAVLGERFVNRIRFSSPGQENELEVAGVFVEIGLVPNSDFAKGVDRNSQNEIIVDCHNRTNLEGVFAAGDVTNVPEKQIIIAAGEGSKALLSAFHYLAVNNFND